MKNVLTIDVEDWYQTADYNVNCNDWDYYESRVLNNTNRILDLLKAYDVKATFYVLGYVAKKHPSIVTRIVNEGHELGTHMMWHKFACSQTPEEFEQDLSESLEVLESISGVKVKCSRMPSWSISKKCLWVLDILEKHGITVDSSVQPFQTFQSGMNNVPILPFHPIVKGKNLTILEVPSSTVNFSAFNFPFCGGLYLRLIPLFIVKKLITFQNKKNPAIIYIHPWEIDSGQPKLNVRFYLTIEHFWGLKKTQFKIEQLLKSFEFGTMNEYVSKSIFENKEM